MRLFLDSSVVLAACGSDRGASAEIIRFAPTNGWSLIASPYVVEEVLANIADMSTSAAERWQRFRLALALVDDVLTLDQAVVFESAKDRPILFSALAWADVLLTHDRRDFGALLGRQFYGLAIIDPGAFLMRERAANRLST